MNTQTFNFKLPDGVTFQNIQDVVETDERWKALKERHNGLVVTLRPNHGETDLRLSSIDPTKIVGVLPELQLSDENKINVKLLDNGYKPMHADFSEHNDSYYVAPRMIVRRSNDNKEGKITKVISFDLCCKK